MIEKRTKIICTIADNRCDADFIRQLYENGMNVVRINSAHASIEGAQQVVDNVRKVSDKIAILIDTKGPEVRLTQMADSVGFVARTGETVEIIDDPSGLCRKGVLYTTYPHMAEDIPVGSDILIDDGSVELSVTDKCEGKLICKVMNEGLIKGHKSVNVPNVHINLPAVTEKDRRFIQWAIKADIDFIAHSFVRSAKDLQEIQSILDAENSHLKIISKIENQQGVDNLDEILSYCYGVMVARGDLGVEIPAERIPLIQRDIVKACRSRKKPVIIATQMLQSMIDNPRPTRAEVTDVANAIFQSSDAIMLSGESAFGKYPVEAVKTMTKIAAQAEKDKLEENDIRIPLDENSNDVTAFLAKQAVKATSKLKIRAIITDSYSGRTARNLAAFRGKYPVLAICYKEKTMRHLALSYGVEAIYMPELANGQEYYFAALRRLLKEGRLQPSDMVGYLSSGKAGTKTSFLEINVVEDALKHAEETVLPNNNRYL